MIRHDHANHLKSVTTGGATYSYAYNGLGDRVSQTVGGVTTHYTLDLNAGLTQVLADGTNTYLYGNERIAQYGAEGPEYFLGDALGSVRQMADNTGEVTLTKSYEPFGDVLNSQGSETTVYGFDGEYLDGYIKSLYLRSRYLSLETGRFLTKDTWQGNYNRPLSLNAWNYAESNPVTNVDPYGYGITSTSGVNTSVSQSPFSSLVTSPIYNLLNIVSECRFSNNFLKTLAESQRTRIEYMYGVRLTIIESKTEGDGVWDLQDLSVAETAFTIVAVRLEASLKTITKNRIISGAELFKRAFPRLEIHKGRYGCMPGTNCWYGHAISDHELEIWGPSMIWGKTNPSRSDLGVKILLHEMGHVLDFQHFGTYALDSHYNKQGVNSEFGKVIDNIKKREVNATADYGITTQSGLGVNYRSSIDNNEIFADLFASWAVNEFHDAIGLQEVIVKGKKVEVPVTLSANGKAWIDFIEPLMANLAYWVSFY